LRSSVTRGSCAAPANAVPARSPGLDKQM
jgi:hypothetical protein